MKWIAILLALTFGTVCGSGATNVVSTPTTNKHAITRHGQTEFLDWLQNNIDPDILDKIGNANFEKVGNFLDAYLNTEDELANLQRQRTEIDTKINQKKHELADIQKKLNLAKISPEALAKIEEYNKSLKHDSTLPEWIQEHRYDIIFTIGISTLFFIFGMLWDKYNEKRKHRKRLKTATSQ